MRRVDIDTHEKEILRGHKNYQRLIIVLICLSVLVAAVVTVSLIKPAVTMTYTCGMEEHTHDESCYELICEKETEEDGSEHVHSIENGCYDTDDPICGLEEHTHSADCRASEDTYETEAASDVLPAETDEAEPLTRSDQDMTEETTEPEDDEVIIATEQTASTEMGRDVEVYDGEPIDFKNHIVSLTFTEESNSKVGKMVFNDLGTSGYIADSDGKIDYKKVRFTISFHFIRRELESSDKIYFDFPNNVKGTNGWNAVSADGELIKENERDGTFTFVAPNGDSIAANSKSRLLVTFNDKVTGKSGDAEIDGDISFDAFVLKTNISSYETVTFGTPSVDVPFNDLDVSKELDKSTYPEGYDEENKKVYYKAVISSKYGTVSSINLTDTLSDTSGNINLDNSFSVEKKTAGGNTENVSVTPTVDGRTASISDLPALGAGESYTVKYSARYNFPTGVYVINIGNGMSAESGSLSDTAYTDGNVTSGCGIESKSGSFKEYNDTIEWTIKVHNYAKTDIKNYTLKDDMFASEYKTIVVNDGTTDYTYDNLSDMTSSADGPLEYDSTSVRLKFKENSDKEIYTIKYYTHVTDIREGYTYVTNTVNLYKDNGELDDTKTGTAAIWERTKVTKDRGTCVLDSYGNYDVKWTNTYKFKYGDFQSNEISDTINSSTSPEAAHYMTYAQANAMVVKGQYVLEEEGWYRDFDLTKGTNYNVTWLNQEGAPITGTLADDTKIYGFKIKLTSTGVDGITLDKVIQISAEYSTTVDVSKVPQDTEVTVTNRTEMKNVPAEGSFSYRKGKAFLKYDISEGVEKTDSYTTHDIADLECGTTDGEKSYRLKWKIDANSAGFYSSETDAVLVDTLPDGVVLDQNSVKFIVGTTEESSTELTYSSNNEVNAAVSGNTVTFTVEKGFHNGNEFFITYDVLFTESYFTDNASSDSLAFKNTVADGTDSSAAAEQTQTIKRTYIQKTATPPGDSYNGYIDYTIEINKEKLDLNPSGDTLTVTDRLESWDKPNENGGVGAGAHAVFQGIPKFYNAETGEELSGDQCSMVEPYYETDDWGQTFACLSFTVPDNMHVRIVYEYRLTFNNDNMTGEYDTEGVKNTATLVEVSQTAQVDSRYSLNQSSAGTVYTTSCMKIKKTETGKPLTLLAGAQFELYKFSSNAWVRVDDTIYGTGSDGTVNLPVLEKDTLYKLKETVAPPGYKITNEYYYFTVDTVVTSTLLSGSGLEPNQVNAKRDSDVITIENTPGGSRLPATGGVGTAIFIIAGCMIMLGAASGLTILTIKRRRFAKADKADATSKNLK